MDTSERLEDWIPGVLSKRQIKALIAKGLIDQAEPGRADHSAIDLRLSDEAYLLPTGSVKPFGDHYLHKLKQDSLAKPIAADADGHFVLTARQTYLFRLKERIPLLGKGGFFWGQATAKSSVGRMDVLARLVVDGMDEYESFEPGRLKSGDLFLEVTPMTFDVVVKPGIPLVQLRLFKGSPTECQIDGRRLIQTVLDVEGKKLSATLSVDLTPDEISKQPACAFVAERDNVKGRPLRLWAPKDDDMFEKPSPHEYWQLEKADQHKRLTIKRDRFYIIRSKELIWLPRGVAVYCRASDESIGEMRIHYAGFVHPFFGTMRDDLQRGTPLIFEVRGHDVNVNLADGEKMARLEFFRMSEDCVPGDDDKEYGSQKLTLSKFFAKWPDAGKLGPNGFLIPA